MHGGIIVSFHNRDEILCLFPYDHRMVTTDTNMISDFNLVEVLMRGHLSILSEYFVADFSRESDTTTTITVDGTPIVFIVLVCSGQPFRIFLL